MDLAGPIEVTPKGKRMRWWRWAAVAILAWVVGTISGVIPGFLVPPAILEGGEETLCIDVESFPPRTELVEIPLASGDMLRGVYVPSDPGAPVVLHLLESSGSVSSRRSYRGLLTDLANSGFASLMVDYRGVGASDGSRSPSHLEEDAWAMWQEALRRGGGDASLVVVRSISIGSLAAASLAEHGARAAAWILIAPVRGESVVRHFAQWQFPGVLSRMASTLFRPATSVDLVSAVARMGPRLWIFSPPDDELLPPDEQAQLCEAVQAAGGAWGREPKPRQHDPATSKSASKDPKWTLGPLGFRPWDASKGKPPPRLPDSLNTVLAMHVIASGSAHDLFAPEESNLLRACFPSWPDREASTLAVLAELPRTISDRFPPASDARKRLESLASSHRGARASLLAAVVLRCEDPEIADQLLSLDRRSPHPWPGDLEYEDILRVLDLDDPSGRLPESSLLDWIRTFYSLRSAGPDVTCALEWERILELARSSEIEAAEGRERRHITSNLKGWTSGVYHCGELWRTLLEERGLSRPDARRQAARILLKAAGIPDRIVQEGNGLARLEIRTNRLWSRLDLEWPDPIETSDVAGASAPGSR